MELRSKHLDKWLTAFDEGVLQIYVDMVSINQALFVVLIGEEVLLYLHGLQRLERAVRHLDHEIMRHLQRRRQTEVALLI